MQKIIYKTDKGISIVHPTPEYPMEFVIERSIPKGIEYWIVDESEIPKDREFRNAWEYDDSIKINVGKAKDIHADRLRIKRKPMLEALDVEYIRAIEEGKDTKKIIDQKQKLRDVTELVKNCKTIEEIKAVKIES